VVKAIRIEGLTAPARSASTGSASTGLTDSDPATIQTAIDPICGMTVTPGPDTPHLHLDGTDHWFCCAGCRDRFADGAA
jgi:xanthine dehydrogenase accessory factor